MEKIFAVGDKVMLKTDHYRDELLRGMRSKKMISRFIGPFNISEKINSNAYRLNLPERLRIHDVINISELEEYHPPDSSNIPHPKYARPPPAFDEEYEIERLISKRNRRGKIQYLVNWKGYPEEESTWEKESNLDHAKGMIEEYERRAT